MNCALPTELLQQSQTVHSYRGLADDSWWVYRYEIGCNGQPLPWGRVVCFCRSEEAAQNWIQKVEAQRG